MFAKLRFLILIAPFFVILSSDAQQGVIPNKIDQKSFDPSTLLWYTQPASKWNEALPVGNGRLGAMVFGGKDEERIQLNEDTYWTGGPYSSVVKGGYKSLPEIQKLVFNGQWLEAQKLFGRTMMGYPVEQQKYQPLGNLMLNFDKGKEYSGYKRWLDLETGISSVEYSEDGVTFHRDVFSSVPDQAIVIRLTASKPGSISFTADLRGVRNQDFSNYATDYFRMDGLGPDELKLTGKSADYLGIEGKLRYDVRLKAVPEGGTMEVHDAILIIRNANTVTLYVAAATNFVNYKDVSADPHARVESYLKNISQKTFDQIRDADIADYKALFDRVSLQLPATTDSYLPTDERLKNITTSPDPELAALAYQFGRYVLISSSRPGTQAANLQGIWNEDSNPAWDAKYTTNINLEMNYWAVESANLSECDEPLIQLVKDLTDQGSQVAKEHYGCRGWVCHQNTDLWRVTAPMDGPTWGTFTTAGAWLCTNLWEHYLFTQDSGYLKDIYPVIKGSVQFFMDFLVQEPGTPWLVTNPSTSPENFPARPGNMPFYDEVTGYTPPGTNICAGSSIDMQILTDLFGDYEHAAKILGLDADFASQVEAARNRLLPPRIGKDGALQEWAEDWGQTEVHHRHLSPLYGLYPGNVFSFSKTPNLMDACKAVLEQRGDESTGWSMAWRIPLWARLHDGNRADKILREYLNEQCNIQLFAKCGAPMQIDGTMGSTAGISEMLVQSQDNTINLLAALPDDWSQGAFKGVCVRGAFELNISWDQHKIDQVELLSKQGELCHMTGGQDVRITCSGKKISFRRLKDGTISFPTSKGAHYLIQYTRV